MKSALFYAVTAGLATAALIKAVPAAAEPAQGGDIAVAIVRTSDLNLAQDEGRRTLDRRLAQAARQVCGEASDFDLEGKTAVRNCVDRTLARARIERNALLAGGQHGRVIAVSAAR